MDLKTFVFGLTPEKREVFAKRCGTTRKHLQNCAYGYRSLATDVAVAIERESEGQVSRKEMFPDNWKDHWPELMTTAEKAAYLATRAEPAPAAEIEQA